METNSVDTSSRFYTKLLASQTAARRSHYPVLDNTVVRFTQEELDEHMGNCVEMVEFFMKTEPFSDFPKTLGVDRNSPQQLVVAIWERIFRTKLVFEAYVSKVERFGAIDGERDMTQTNNIKESINSKHNFKKGGCHKRFVYNNTPSLTPANKRMSFNPVTSLLKSIRNTCHDKVQDAKKYP